MSELLQTSGAVAGIALLYLVMLAGTLAIPLGVPGQFAIVIGVLIFNLVAGGGIVSWPVFFGLLGLAVLAEVLEALAGFLGAAKAQGSLWSSFGALVGGMAGALIGTLIAPLVGSLLGAFAGTFAGAFSIEYYHTQHSGTSARVAQGALLGRVLGSVCKTVIASVMIVIVTVALVVD